MNRPIDERRWREVGNNLLAELRRLSAILLRIQEHVEAISEQNQASNQGEQPTPVLRAQLQIPEAVERNRKCENTKKSRREWTAIGVNALTLFAVAAYALINYHMLGEMRQANQAAKKSLGVAIDALKLDKRGWVGISPPALLYSVRFDYLQNINTHYNFVVKNFGPSMALKVVARFEAAAKNNLDGSVKDLCDSVENESRTKANCFSLFPGQEVGHPGYQLGPVAKAFDLDDSLYIIGCIVYQDQFGTEHRTRTCFATLGGIREIAKASRPQVLSECFIYNDAY